MCTLLQDTSSLVFCDCFRADSTVSHHALCEIQTEQTTKHHSESNSNDNVPLCSCCYSMDSPVLIRPIQKGFVYKSRWINVILYLRTSVILMANSHGIRNLCKTTRNGRFNSICSAPSLDYRHVCHVRCLLTSSFNRTLLLISNQHVII